jgi:hypothetical protein
MRKKRTGNKGNLTFSDVFDSDLDIRRRSLPVHKTRRSISIPSFKTKGGQPRRRSESLNALDNLILLPALQAPIARTTRLNLIEHFFPRSAPRASPIFPMLLRRRS